MKIFLGWSGARSKQVATALREWLPNVIQSLEPWMSEEDIQKGDAWPTVLVDALEHSGSAIVCLTKENLTEPWLLFEAGASAFRLGKQKRLFTYLLDDVEPGDLAGPLRLFQATSATQEDTLRLLKSINRNGNDLLLDEDRLCKSFGAHWDSLGTVLTNPPSTRTLALPGFKKRTSDEKIDELLQSNRRMEATLTSLETRMPETQAVIPSSTSDANAQALQSFFESVRARQRLERVCVYCGNIIPDGEIVSLRPDGARAHRKCAEEKRQGMPT